MAWGGAVLSTATRYICPSNSNLQATQVHHSPRLLERRGQVVLVEELGVLKARTQHGLVARLHKAAGCWCRLSPKQCPPAAAGDLGSATSAAMNRRRAERHEFRGGKLASSKAGTQTHLNSGQVNRAVGHSHKVGQQLVCSRGRSSRQAGAERCDWRVDVRSSSASQSRAAAARLRESTAVEGARHLQRTVCSAWASQTPMCDACVRSAAPSAHPLQQRSCCAAAPTRLVLIHREVALVLAHHHDQHLAAGIRKREQLRHA